ncbi:MAG: hypothetical protein M0R21_09440 [Lentimicrobiaceae bacterium]|nr:hypothetical protein [Lentimicrobiaceae bacterium]
MSIIKWFIVVSLFFVIICNCNKKEETDTQTTSTDCNVGSNSKCNLNDEMKSISGNCSLKLINDMWGIYDKNGTKPNTFYCQCIFNNGNIFGWKWQWPHDGGLALLGIKSYPEILFGRNPYNNNASTTSLLPIMISNIDQIQVTYTANLNLLTQTTNQYNLSFDLWVTDSQTPTSSNIKAEIMIWELANTGFTPPSNIPTYSNVPIGGQYYDLYEYPHGLDPYWTHSFVSKSTPNISNRIINLKPFLDYLINKNDFSTDRFLSNVTFGTELYEGSGTITFTDYAVNISTLQTNNSDFKITRCFYTETNNIEQAVVNEFGSNYRIADWNDIVSYCQSNSPDQFINNLNWQLGEENSFIVIWNGQHFYNNGTRHFYISRFDHNKPIHYLAHDNIDNHHIDLGSWYGLNMPILCIKK